MKAFKIGIVLVMALVGGLLASCSSTAAAKAEIAQVDFAYIAEHADSATLIDARDFVSYAGELHNDADRKGHVPGAISLPYENLLEKTGEPISEVRLERIFNHANLATSDEIIIYGEGAESAEGMAQIFTSMGYTNVAVCTESFETYMADPANEVEKSSLSCCVE